MKSTSKQLIVAVILVAWSEWSRSETASLNGHHDVTSVLPSRHFDSKYKQLSEKKQYSTKVKHFGKEAAEHGRRVARQLVNQQGFLGDSVQGYQNPESYGRRRVPLISRIQTPAQDRRDGPPLSYPLREGPNRVVNRITKKPFGSAISNPRPRPDPLRFQLNPTTVQQLNPDSQKPHEEQNELNPYELFPPSFHELLDIPLHVYKNGSTLNPHEKYKKPAVPPVVISGGYANTKIQGYGKPKQDPTTTTTTTVKPRPAATRRPSITTTRRAIQRPQVTSRKTTTAPPIYEYSSYTDNFIVDANQEITPPNGGFGEKVTPIPITRFSSAGLPTSPKSPTGTYSTLGTSTPAHIEVFPTTYRPSTFRPKLRPGSRPQRPVLPNKPRPSLFAQIFNNRPFPPIALRNPDLDVDVETDNELDIKKTDAFTDTNAHGLPPRLEDKNPDEVNNLFKPSPEDSLPVSLSSPPLQRPQISPPKPLPVINKPDSNPTYSRPWPSPPPRLNVAETPRPGEEFRPEYQQPDIQRIPEIQQRPNEINRPGTATRPDILTRPKIRPRPEIQQRPDFQPRPEVRPRPQIHSHQNIQPNPDIRPRPVGRPRPDFRPRPDNQLQSNVQSLPGYQNRPQPLPELVVVRRPTETSEENLSENENQSFNPQAPFGSGGYYRPRPPFVRPGQAPPQVTIKESYQPLPNDVQSLRRPQTVPKQPHQVVKDNSNKPRPPGPSYSDPTKESAEFPLSNPHTQTGFTNQDNTQYVFRPPPFAYPIPSTGDNIHPHRPRPNGAHTDGPQRPKIPTRKNPTPPSEENSSFFSSLLSDFSSLFGSSSKPKETVVLPQFRPNVAYQTENTGDIQPRREAIPSQERDLPQTEQTDTVESELPPQKRIPLPQGFSLLPPQVSRRRGQGGPYVDTMISTLQMLHPALSKPAVGQLIPAAAEPWKQPVEIEAPVAIVEKQTDEPFVVNGALLSDSDIMLIGPFPNPPAGAPKLPNLHSLAGLADDEIVTSYTHPLDEVVVDADSSIVQEEEDTNHTTIVTKSIPTAQSSSIYPHAPATIIAVVSTVKPQPGKSTAGSVSETEPNTDKLTTAKPSSTSITPSRSSSTKTTAAEETTTEVTPIKITTFRSFTAGPTSEATKPSPGSFSVPKATTFSGWSVVVGDSLKHIAPETDHRQVHDDNRPVQRVVGSVKKPTRPNQTGFVSPQQLYSGFKPMIVQ